MVHRKGIVWQMHRDQEHRRGAMLKGGETRQRTFGGSLHESNHFSLSLT